MRQLHVHKKKPRTPHRNKYTGPMLAGFRKRKEERKKSSLVEHHP
jgi:hypothetical protein